MSVEATSNGKDHRSGEGWVSCLSRLSHSRIHYQHQGGCGRKAMGGYGVRLLSWPAKNKGRGICVGGGRGGDREKKSLREVSKGCGSVSVAGAGSGRDEGERESERFREIRRQHRSSGDRDVPRTVDGMGRRVWRQEESEARQGTAMGTTDDSRFPAHCLFSGESRHSLELCPLARGNGEGERVGMGSCVRMLAPQTEYVHDYG
ncbi:hypothetical protein CH063_08823 [Colletotrichum higginsianum]|uniref:Uncharacterized protein n=1 Tax=Colletotrichum higginsianum (strain IMI 349063) TaxID=759273 RepID=H1VBA5_COLHI|nr:hypothetical protein CH063_08823 [Colletotrichum higginsianum]